MSIQKAGVADVKEITALEREWEKEGISWGVEHATKKDLIHHIRKDIVYVVKDRMKLIGYIIGKISKAEGSFDWANLRKGQRYGYIDSMYVAKKYRGKGIGRNLVKKLVEDLKKERIRVVRLKAVSKNLRKLISFYKKLYFKEKMCDMCRRIK